MAYRIAKSLAKFRSQINDRSPSRNKTSDGWIGDAAHASRSSDHNPWIKQGGVGVVTAFDLTHEPKNGVDCNKIAEAIKDDPRVKYVPAFSEPAERVVYDFASTVVTDGRVGDELYRTAVVELGERAVVELVTLIGYYTMVAFTLNVFDIPAPGGLRPLDT